jgi:acyl dehydratase
MAIHRASEPKRYSWENITAGEDLGWVEGVVSDFYIKMHAFAVDDYGDWYLKDSPFGGRIGHPTLLANDILRLFFLIYDPRPPFARGLHAKNELELLRPVKLGDKVVVSGKHTEKYERRGQKIRVVEGQATDEAGRSFIRMRTWETVGLGSTTPVGQGTGKPSADLITGEVPAGAPVVPRAGKHVPVGAVLPSITKHTTLEQSIAFSGSVYGWVEGGAKSMRFSIHTDPEDARKRGARDGIVQGLCSAAYLSEICTNFFGPLWLTTGHLATNFIRPVIVRDDITACGMVKRLEAEAGKTRIHLDIWCKNQNGELATVGRASALAE